MEVAPANVVPAPDAPAPEESMPKAPGPESSHVDDFYLAVTGSTSVSLATLALLGERVLAIL